MREFVELTQANIWFTVAMVMVFATIFILSRFTNILKREHLVAEITILVVGILWWTLVHYRIVTLNSLGAVLFIIVGGFGIWRETTRRKAGT